MNNGIERVQSKQYTNIIQYTSPCASTELAHLQVRHAAYLLVTIVRCCAWKWREHRVHFKAMQDDAVYTLGDP